MNAQHRLADKVGAPVNSDTRTDGEDLFQSLLDHLPQSANSQQLEEATVTGLRLLLRRPEDHDLMAPMEELVASIIRGVPPDALADAAQRCIQILNEASNLRKPRKVVYMERRVGIRPKA